MRVADLPLRGAGGEPVDFARTIVSHGVAELPPNRVDLEARTLETTLPVPGGARTVRLTAVGGKLRLEAVAGSAGTRVRDALTASVSHMFRLDEDLSAFYALVAADVELSWCGLGADGCCARQRSSKMSSRRSERPYESSREFLLPRNPKATHLRTTGSRAVSSRSALTSSRCGIPNSRNLQEVFGSNSWPGGSLKPGGVRSDRRSTDPGTARR